VWGIDLSFTKSKAALLGIYIYGECQTHARKGEKKMKTKFLLSTVLVLTVVLAACAPATAAPTEKVTVPTSKPPVTQPTTAPTTAAKPTPTTMPTTKPTTVPTQKSDSTPAATTEAPFATPTTGPALINDIIVKDQDLKSGAVLVSMVDALKPGWVAFFTDEKDQPGKLLGYTEVPAGTTSDVSVTVNASSAPSKMIAMLLVDAGKIGTFEYPGPDVAVKNADVNSDVMAIFSKVKS
jgi:hypothetical protein